MSCIRVDSIRGAVQIKSRLASSILLNRSAGVGLESQHESDAITLSRCVKYLLQGLAALCMCSLTYAAERANSQLAYLLAECSPKYFQVLQSEITKFQRAGYTFEKSAKVSRLIVKDRKDQIGTDWLAMGKTPITVGPFKVVGMYDLERRTKTYETYDWGLLVEGKTEDVAKMVDALLPVNRRLEFDGCSLSRDWNERS